MGATGLRRIIAAAVCFVMLLTGCGLGRDQVTLAQMGERIDARGGYRIAAAVLYCPGVSKDWKTTLDYLRQSTAVNLDPEALPAETAGDLKQYDVVYLDESLLELSEPEALRNTITEYVKGGGFLSVPNGLCLWLPDKLLGISEAVKLDGFPETPEYPAVRTDYLPVQELIRDFHGLYQASADFETLRQKDYGYGFRVRSASALCTFGDLALYTINGYGKGTVLLLNPLLPSRYQASGFDMAVGNGQTAFSCTAASCGQMLLAEVAMLAAKERYGFALERVYGSYGSPSMSWELHYEDITAYAKSVMIPFSEQCEAAGQIPSYAIVRNTYAWFAQTETMGYAINSSGGAEDLAFSLDRYESAYSSGTHIDSGGQWLQLDTLQTEGSSYFDDHPEENYRLYPALTDYDGDGLLDAFCGSHDGASTSSGAWVLRAWTAD